MVVRKPILGLLAMLATASHAQAERLPLPLALPEGAQSCALDGWAASNGLFEVVLRASPDNDGKALGIVPVADASKIASHGSPLYPAQMTIEKYSNGWLKVSALTDQENEEAARDLPPIPGWVQANAIRFNIQSGQGHEAPLEDSRVLIDMKDEWATEVGVIDQVYACQGDWVLVDYRQTLERDENDALIPLAAEQQFRKQAWFRNPCGDLFTTCDRGTGQ